MEQLNKLIEDHLYLVHIALKSNVQKPPFCYMDEEELIAAGNLGLVEAAHKYAKGAETPFPAYASSRIVGEMKDTGRKLRWGKIKGQKRCEPLDDSRPAKSHCDVDLFYEELTQPLDPVAKKAFLWHYRDQYTMAEVAEKLGMGRWGESRVSKLLTKSKDIIRETYQAHELFADLSTE